MLPYYVAAISLIASIVVGAFVLASNIKSRLHHIYGLLTLAIIGISLANALSLDPELNQLMYMRVVMVASTLGLLFLYAFIQKIQGASLRTTLFGLLCVFTVGVAVLDGTPLVFSGIAEGTLLRPEIQVGAYLFALHAVTMIVLSVSVLLRGMRNATSKQKKQYKFLLAGIVPVLVLAPSTSFVLPLFFGRSDLVVLSPLYGLFFVVCVGYAIARYGLFDIRRAAVRTMAYVLTLGVLALVYYLLAYTASLLLFSQSVHDSPSVGVSNVVLALLLAFVFQPIKGFFDRITNNIFYRDNYSTEEFFASVNRTLTSTTELRTLLERIALEVGGTLKAEQAFLFAYHAKDRYVSAGTKNHAMLTMSEARQLDEVASGCDFAPILVDDPQLLADARAIMTKRRISLLLPLDREGRAIGYLALGVRRSGRFSSQDVRALETIADGLVIAIQNALSVHEVKDLNANLQQRIDDATKELRDSNEKLHRLDATKDEFVSMASHQLRTPLTSVKGYISMVLDGDAGKISDMQKKLLGEAFTSSERMVHLINDFLNVSRLQTGKFMIDKKAVDLSKMIDQEVNSLQTTAKSRNLTMKYRAPSAFPILYVDEGKLRQVVMNFIDNAFYYSREHSTVIVSLETLNGDAVLKVKDAGMGVPEAEQKRLFTKFFRATNARKQRPDGTGVGLFLAKKVITAHGGSMVFESIEGKGSTFGFRLPIKKLSLAPADDADKLED